MRSRRPEYVAWEDCRFRRLCTSNDIVFSRGAHWSAPAQLARAMTLSQIASTSQDPMVGDSISTSFAGRTATTVFAVGVLPTGTAFDEAMYAPSSPLAVASPAAATRPSSSAGDVAPVSGVGTRAAIRALKDD